MHEYQLTLSIIDIALRYVQNPTDKVKEIHLVIGESAGILGECIRLYFHEISMNTPCENAEIHIEWVKQKLKCNTCGGYFIRKPFDFSCTLHHCKGEGEPTKIGHEFYVKNIVV